MIGLGAMGSRMVRRLQKHRISVVGYDPHAQHPDITQVAQLCELISCDIIWIMVPHTAVDRVLDELIALKTRALIIDGGNSYYRDSVVRATRCAAAGIAFLDCGVSSGIIAEQGYCLMVGGARDAYLHAEPIFTALAAPKALLYCGPSGAGHFVKMIHNGIEYSLLQAYAEGFELLSRASYTFDAAKIAETWNHGSLIQSRLLGLFAQALKQPNEVAKASGAVAESGMGEWTVREAEERGVSMPVLVAARKVRAVSRDNPSQRSLATQLIQMVRHIFGGHPL